MVCSFEFVNWFIFVFKYCLIIHMTEVVTCLSILIRYKNV